MNNNEHNKEDKVEYNLKNEDNKIVDVSNDKINACVNDNIIFNGNDYNKDTNYNPYFINGNNNYGYNPTNSNNDDKNRKDIKRLKVLVILLFIICICSLAFVLSKSFISTRSSNSKNNDEEKSDVELKYTDTIDSKSEGTYVIDVSDVVDNVMPSIVAITSKTLVNSGNYGPFSSGRSQYATGAGSGIIVSKSDNELLILTNKHVIEDAEQLSVKFIDDESVDATVKGASTSKDIAIISIPLKSIKKETLDKIKIATMGKSTDLKVGQGVIAIGNALGYGQSVTTGVISALNREVTIDNISTNMIQTDAAINGGNSGGALLNSKGEVIGINSAKYSSSSYTSSASIEGMGFAIPISDVSDLINKLMNGENLTEEQRGYLGVSGYMITDENNEMQIPKGFYINSIVKNSGADKAGLSIGNIITKIEGNEVKQFSDITEVLENKKSGSKVKLTIKYSSGREYKEKTVTLTLSSYKEVNS